MSAAAIKAGKAWVEFAIDDKTSPGLAAVQKKFITWGTGLAKVGGIISAAAGSIVGTLSAAAKSFAHTGSEIYDMSRATGVGAEDLSALGYAAEQSGASMHDVAAAMKGLGKFTGQVSAGNKIAAKTLEHLGISAADFLAATPYQKFLLVADALNSIQDPSMRTALGMKVLGKGAIALGSLMAEGAAGVEQLVGEAKQLGLVITSEEAKKADALGDAWDAVGKQMKQIAFVVGAAVADVFTAIGQAIQPVLAGTISFIRANQGLVTGLAFAAGIALGVGVAFLGAAAAAYAASAAMFIYSTAVTVYNAVMTYAVAITTALLTPWGLVIASLAVLGVALIAATGYWLYFNETARSAVKGIYDAIVSGNWALAGQIAMAALNVAWQAGIGQLKQLWIDFNAWLIKLFAGLVDAWAEVKDVFGFDESAGSTRQFGEALRGTASGMQAEANRESARKVAEAQAALAKLVAQASKLREEAFKPPKLPELPGAGGAAASPLDSGFAAGTFNASATRLLSSSGENAHERTAKATEATVEKLDEVKDAIEELDLADTE